MQFVKPASASQSVHIVQDSKRTQCNRRYGEAWIDATSIEFAASGCVDCQSMCKARQVVKQAAKDSDIIVTNVGA